jgi:N-acetylglucosaminyldiphosphoundecaprenol N-acetyl-beta-D-mannosaminyltransferase
MILKCGEIFLFSVAPEKILNSKGKEFCHIVTVNSEIFSYAHEVSRLKKILLSTVNTIDGRILQWICKIFYPFYEIKKISGADLIYKISEWCLSNSKELFLLGATEESNKNAQLQLKRTFPGLKVYGFSPEFCDYPFNSEWNKKVLEEIKAIRPEYLVVCFGPIKQEFWIHENEANLKKMGVKFAYGLGGTIDFVSGAKKRAPRWIQWVGGEWFFRFLSEPKNRFKRTLIMFKMFYYAVKTRKKILEV